MSMDSKRRPSIFPMWPGSYFKGLLLANMFNPRHHPHCYDSQDLYSGISGIREEKMLQTPTSVSILMSTKLILSVEDGNMQLSYCQTVEFLLIQ